MLERPMTKIKPEDIKRSIDTISQLKQQLVENRLNQHLSNKH
jgi:hypothetical protein